MRQSVSVVATVYNEAASIDALLTSLVGQSRPPDEIVIADGGSTDGTYERLCAFAKGARLPLRVLLLPGANISQGRNAAIAAASGPIVAVTDAGVRLESDWLAHLTALYDHKNPPTVVAGFFVADPRTLFERVLGAVTLPERQEIDPERFYPSSRSVAFSRQAWQAVGGYPEWLDYCEDLVFDFALADAGYRFAFAPRAVVHFRPRQTLGAFFRQYYRYARGDGKADLWRVRHAIRYVTYLVAAPVLLALGLWHHPLWLLGLAAGLAVMLRTPLRRLAPQLRELSWGDRLLALAWLPLVRVTGDLAKMVGYPVGVWWRWQHAPAAPWPKRQL